jgi:hypothetical protein
MLILWNFFAAAGFFLTANSAVQEAAVGVVWIAVNQPLCLWVQSGRRRIFISRKPEPEERL